MKTLKILLILVIVALFVSTATAATVTITGGGINCTGTLTLGNVNVDGSGNVSLSVTGTCNGGTCTPSSASVSPLSIVRNIATGVTAASQTVSITDNCGTNLGYSASVTSGSNFISVPTSGTETPSMSITFNTSGLAAGSYSGSISVTPTGYSAQTISVSITVSSGGGGNAINIGAKYPPNVYVGSIAANGENHYYFVLDQNVYAVEIDMLTADWATNQDVIVSTVRQPACSDITAKYAFGPTFWYGPNSSSNETVTLGPNVAAGTIYVTVCNRSARTGQFKLYWMTY